jgi:hypothetical protein
MVDIATIEKDLPTVIADLEKALNDAAPMLPPGVAAGISAFIVKLNNALVLVEKYEPMLNALAAVQNTSGGPIEKLGAIAKALM